MNTNCTKLLVLCMLTLPVPATVWADSGPGAPGGKRKPPQEAFDACTGKSEGDSVTVTTPRGDTIKATCRQINGGLAALPDRCGPPPDNGAPPPERKSME